MLLAGLWFPAGATTVTVYRCVDAEGRVTLQDSPCPPGQRQQRREFERPLDPVPVPAPPPVEPPAEPEPAEPPPAPPEPPAPPPPLWECETWDGDRYTSESGETVPRCVPLAVQGWDMRGLPPEQAAACEWKRDTCRRLDDAKTCPRWRSMRTEAERELRQAFGDTREHWQAEFERLDGIVNTHCR